MFKQNFTLFLHNSNIGKMKITREQISKALLEEQDSLIENLRLQVKRYNIASDIDEDDTLDPEDLSQQTQAKDLQLRFQQQLDAAIAQKNYLQDADTLKMIDTGNIVFVLGASMQRFSVGDKEVLGVSEEAPAYSELASVEEGKSFTLGNDRYTVKHIL